MAMYVMGSVGAHENATAKVLVMTMLPTRKHVRLKGFDYSTPGYYFITICTSSHHNILGRLTGEGVELSHLGEAVQLCWKTIPLRYPEYQTDLLVIMPNHLHGLLFLSPPLSVQESASIKRHPVGQVIRAFKAAVTRMRNQTTGNLSAPMWQRGYYDHVVRNELDLERARDYILTNPVRKHLKGKR